MGRPREVADMLLAGQCPRDIAYALGISYASVKQYLWTAIGAGFIRRSDVLFSIPSQEREVFEQLIAETDSPDLSDIWRRGSDRLRRVNQDHLRTYLELRDVRVCMGDMYEFLSSVEVTLHKAIRAVLLAEYGDPDWWRKGVPERVRVECAQLLEQDAEAAPEPYCYTTFIHLRDILDKQWALFSQRLPASVAQDKKELLAELLRLNSIRNRVMHPVKGGSPTEDEFQFVRAFQKQIQPSSWRRWPRLSE
jgi:hypothetical protein